MAAEAMLAGGIRISSDGACIHMSSWRTSSVHGIKRPRFGDELTLSMTSQPAAAFELSDQWRTAVYAISVATLTMSSKSLAVDI